MYKIEAKKYCYVKSTVLDFYDSKINYFPITTPSKLLVKENDYVFKGQLLVKNSNIYSSVSGEVVDIVKINDLNYIVIENDYKERYELRHGYYKIKTNYELKELKSLINDVIPYSFQKEYESILVNGIVIDPYSYTNVFLFDESRDIILDTLSALGETFHCPVNLVLSTNYSHMLRKIIDNIGKYCNIFVKVITPYYPLDNNIFLKKYLKIENKKLLELNINDIYEIGYILKYGRIPLEKLVTISGNLVTKPTVIRCKLGCSIKEVLKKVKIKSSKNKVIILNNRLNGLLITDDYFVNRDTDLILVGENCLREESECINCGLCLENCPVEIDPKRKNKNCLNCNLCSYVCPSNINLKEKRNKNE